MLSVIIAVAIFRYYQKLATRYGKVHWHYGLLGIGIFVGIQLLFGILYGLIGVLTDPNNFSHDVSNFSAFSTVNLLGLVLSLLVVWSMYRYIENNLEKKKSKTPSEIEEIGKTDAE